MVDYGNRETIETTNRSFEMRLPNRQGDHGHNITATTSTSPAHAEFFKPAARIPAQEGPASHGTWPVDKQRCLHKSGNKLIGSDVWS